MIHPHFTCIFVFVGHLSCFLFYILRQRNEYANWFKVALTVVPKYCWMEELLRYFCLLSPHLLAFSGMLRHRVRKPTLPLKFDELLLGSIDLFEALQYFYMHTIRDSVKSFF